MCKIAKYVMNKCENKLANILEIELVFLLYFSYFYKEFLNDIKLRLKQQNTTSNMQTL